jgi:hypothetical protein
MVAAIWYAPKYLAYADQPAKASEPVNENETLFSNI